MTSVQSKPRELTAKQRLAVSREALLMAARQTMLQGLKRLAVQSVSELLKSLAKDTKKQDSSP
jgi:hypothetical protein